MSIITVTTELNEKNTRTINTKNGEKQVVSVPIVKDSTGKWVYASAFINFAVKVGDTLTISGRVEQKQDKDYLNNSFVFPTVERMYKPNNTQSKATDIPGTDVEIDDADLPF
ncbi:MULTISPECIES: single-stranded DNA-binding protein [unclassified Lactococcus]|nr:MULTISPECIES: single-stranded DNA-binding protein [unclassified Lactococcus]MQW22968.1 hypothetical protein [Lactococcus sp. dk101]TXK44488.1 hypothetical protein FVP42_04335 [Lactococcus sp. dk310]TXK50473.1 hypothetical protein FVP43_04305 [Lactococcus sp. dk322]